MGAMGRYIDALTDEHRDRIITGQRWGHDFVDRVGCRCLCGHAEDWRRDEYSLWSHAGMGSLVYDANPYGLPVFNVFPVASKRFGLDRVVRAVKLRAARLNGCSPEAIAALTAPHEQPQAVLP